LHYAVDAVITILIYSTAPAPHITEAAAWWHARRGDVFRVEVVTDPPTPDDNTVAVYVVPAPLQCGIWPALGCSEWHKVTIVDGAGPWVAAHELGHAVYGLPDLYEGLDIMNPFQAREAYEVGAVGCASLAALGAPCRRVYLPIAAG
jgi:hypothetical protein